MPYPNCSLHYCRFWDTYCYDTYILLFLSLWFLLLRRWLLWISFWWMLHCFAVYYVSSASTSFSTFLLTEFANSTLLISSRIKHIKYAFLNSMRYFQFINGKNVCQIPDHRIEISFYWLFSQTVFFYGDLLQQNLFINHRIHQSNCLNPLFSRPFRTNVHIQWY